MANIHELGTNSSPIEERNFLDSWKPEPLVPEVDAQDNDHLLNPHVITSKPGKYITIDGIERLNLGTNNYLGLADNPKLEEASIEAVKRYGVGSCGPRAFYGTMDVHLKLEEELADFLAVQEAVLYSFGFSTIASAIPAYAKATDVIFVDECCNFAIQQGINASKSKVIKFKHNNIEHLESQIQSLFNVQRNDDIKTKKTVLRSFLVVEGIYSKTGDICPLNELIEVKKKYKIRLFVDESRSFGVLGTSGKGVTQHFNADICDVDLIMASLENALCAFGGFCAGSSYVIDHQRLAGTGYCFSASLPPLQTRAALESLKIIRENPLIIKNAQEVFKYAHEKLSNLSVLNNISHPLSPIKVLMLNTHSSLINGAPDYKDDEKILTKMCSEIFKSERIAITVARYLNDEEMTNLAASVRLNINACLSSDDIDRIFLALERCSLMFFVES